MIANSKAFFLLTPYNCEISFSDDAPISYIRNGDAFIASFSIIVFPSTFIDEFHTSFRPPLANRL